MVVWSEILLKIFKMANMAAIMVVWEEMSFEDFQDGQHGGHLGNQNQIILAVLILHVASMPPTKFRLNLT